MRALLIAEKPSLKNDIQKIYKGMNFPDEITFMALTGHVLELQEPEDYDASWGGSWNHNVLPMIPENFVYKPADKTMKLYKDVKAEILSGKYDYLINACDAGREGELIFYSLYKTVGKKIPVKRYWATNQTDEAIVRALNNLMDDKEEVLKNLKASSQYRAYFDWLIGMNFTRAISVSTGATVSVGRVVTPTLALIVERELEILNFKPQTFFEVSANFANKYKGTWFSPEDDSTRFDKKEDAQKVIAKSGSKGIVAEVTEKQETKKAPTLYSLTELQKEANKEFGYTGDETLAIAQKLYETRKLLTYPRTESRFLPKDMVKDVPKHLNAIKNISEVKEEATKVIADTALIQRVLSSKDYVDDAKVTDHHAILPTMIEPLMGALSEDEKNIYLMVVRRFLSIFLPPLKVLNTTIITDANGQKYKTTGKVILDKGYTVLYQGGTKETVLPKVKKGDAFDITEFNLDEKQTTPPKRYDDGTLLGAMQSAGKSITDDELRKVMRDAEGLGTTATRGSIIEKIVKNGTVERRGKGKVKQFYATDKGIKIIQGLNGKDIISPQLTAEWEKKLKMIENGKFPPAQFYKEMIEYIKSETTAYKTTKVNIPSTGGGNYEVKVLGKCPKCGKDFVEGKSYYLCSDYQKGCDFIVSKVINNTKIPEAEVKKLIAGKPTKPFKFKWKSGTESEVPLVLDKNNKVIFGFAENTTPSTNTGQKNGSTGTENLNDKPTIGKCPKCGSPVVEGNDFFLCKKYSDTCDFNLKKVIKSANIDKDDAVKILSGEKTKQITFSWGNGKSGPAQLYYDNGLKFAFPPR